MLGLNRRVLLGAMVTLAVTVGAVWLAFSWLVPAPPQRIVIASGSPGGAYEFYANKYREILARHRVTLEVRPSHGSVDNLRLLQDPKSGVKAAFVQGGVSNSTQAPDLESMGRINYLGFFVFCRAADPLRDLTELKGHRIAIGPSGSGTNLVVTKLLRTNGITPQNATFVALGGRPAVDALDAGKVDVVIMGSVLEAPLVQNLLRDPGLRLVSLQRAKALVRKFPSLVRLEMPAGVIDLEKNIPAADVTLVGTTSSLLVRGDLHPEIVGLLARAMVQVNGEPGVFQQFGEFPTASDPEYPMAEAARDYYRNGPSFLHRYLPFWVTTYARRVLAILVTAIAIVVPIFNYGPKLYLWLLRRRIMALYRELRAVETRLSVAAPGEIEDLAQELERIDHASAVLPMRHSDQFFALRTHIDLVRRRLLERGGPATGQPRPRLVESRA